VTGDIGTVLSGHCAVCGGHVALTRLGLARQHRTKRVDSRGRTYAAADICVGSGEAPTPLDGA
jgi:hypothetical protein